MAEETKKRTVAIGRHLSQLKRQRQNLKLRAANQALRSSARTAIKKVLQAVNQKDKNLAQTSLRAATSVLHKVAAKNIFHKRNAARKIASLSKIVSSL